MQNNSSIDVKIPFLKKVGYGFGEAGSQFSFTLVSTYLTVFYTDVVGLTPAVISVIMLVARIWDAVNDPMFGIIAQNTSSRWGRYRPYILFGAPVLAVFNCLTFFKPEASVGVKAMWCALTYIGCDLAYTAVNISTGSIVNSMTSIVKERVLLNSFRGVLGSAAGVVISATAMPMILKFGDGSAAEGDGYFIAAVVYSIIGTICLWVCAASSKEVIVVKKRPQKRGNIIRTLFNSFRYIFQDRDAAMLVLSMILYLTGVFGRMGIMTYYFIYVLGDVDSVALCATALTLGMIIPNLYTPALFRRIDKKYCGVIACVCQMVCCILFFVLGQTGNIPAVAVVTFIFGATNFAGQTSQALCGEIVDNQWITTGIRADGVVYSCISFATKLGNAIGGSVGIVALGMVGFVANTEMPKAVLTRINAVINLGPAFFFVLAIIPFLCMKMTNKLSEKNENKIREMTKEERKM